MYGWKSQNRGGRTHLWEVLALFLFIRRKQSIPQGRFASCLAVKCRYTWQDRAVYYIFPQYLEPCRGHIPNLQLSPQWLRLSGHILQHALSLLHHRRHYRPQTALYPTYKTAKGLIIICFVLRVCLSEWTEHKLDLGGQRASWQLLGSSMVGGLVLQ